MAIHDQVGAILGIKLDKIAARNGSSAEAGVVTITTVEDFPMETEEGKK